LPARYQAAGLTLSPKEKAHWDTVQNTSILAA
jgi:hypothetical protein